MSERAWKIAWILTAVGSCTVFIHISIGCGYLLGALISLLLYRRNESYWSRILDRGSARRGTGFLHFLVNYGLMAGSMIFAAFFPQYANIFACAIGLMVIKFATVIDALI